MGIPGWENREITGTHPIGGSPQLSAMPGLYGIDAVRMPVEYAQPLHRGSRGSMYTRKAHAIRKPQCVIRDDQRDAREGQAGRTGVGADESGADRRVSRARHGRLSVPGAKKALGKR